jgi:hypothetical protein
LESIVHHYFRFGQRKILEMQTPVIIYDLKCKNNHEFEGWFNDRAAFEQQQEQFLITCPVCGEAGAEMVLPAPSIRTRNMKASDTGGNASLSPLKAMQQMHAFIEKHFDDVGEAFAETAMKIHDGEEEAKNIRGVTTPEEEDRMREKGIPFFKIPVVKYDS